MRHSTSALRESLVKDPDSIALTGFRYGARDLLRLEPSLEQIIVRLERYQLSVVLEILGRMNAVLRRSGTNDIEAQISLVRALFPQARTSEILGRLGIQRQRAISEGQDGLAPSPSLFEPRQVTYMGVLAGVYALSDSRIPDIPLEGLGEALLMLNDLVDVAVTPEGRDHSTPEGRKSWAHYFAVAAFSQGDEGTVPAVVRAVDIFLDPHEGLHDDPNYVDLRALFEEATGLSLEAYIVVTVALIARMQSITIDNAHESSAIVNHDYFSVFPVSVRRLFFQLTGVDHLRFQDLARSDSPVGELRPFKLLAVEQSPLVHFGDSSVCLSTKYLERRLTTGLYHILLNARSGNEHASFRLKLQRYIGAVFESYIVRSLARMQEILSAKAGWHPKERRGRGPVWFVTESELRSALPRQSRNSTSVCDAILVVGRDAFFIECKARVISSEARSGRDPDMLFEKLSEITVKGSRQIDSTITHFFAGDFSPLGLESSRIQRVFPIVVSMDELPISPEVRSWIDEELQSAAILQRSGGGHAQVFSPEFMSGKDWNWLELALEKTSFRPGNLIERKHSRTFWYGISFGTWGHISRIVDDNRGSKNAQWQEKRWNELTDRTRDFFKRFAESPEPT